VGVAVVKRFSAAVRARPALAGASSE